MFTGPGRRRRRRCVLRTWAFLMFLSIFAFYLFTIIRFQIKTTNHKPDDREFSLFNLIIGGDVYVLIFYGARLFSFN